MIFAIHAYEDLYGGYHGVEDWDFIEAESEEDYTLLSAAWETIPLPLATSIDECRAELNSYNDPEGICEKYGG